LGTGFETRDFIYIKDLVKAIEIVIKNCDFRGDVINLASGTDITIADTIKIFVNEFNPDLTINFNHQVKIGDPVNWRADISKLIDMGFEIEYDLKQGLKETSEWLKNQF
jgi:nucleoside-diphosphate-sugar epimerase